MKDQVIQSNSFSVTLKVQTSKDRNVTLVSEQNAKDPIMSIRTPLLCILAQFICLFVSDNKEMTGVNHIYIRSHGNCMSNETLSLRRVTLNFSAWLYTIRGTVPNSRITK